MINEKVHEHRPGVGVGLVLNCDGTEYTLQQKKNPQGFDHIFFKPKNLTLTFIAFL